MRFLGTLVAVGCLLLAVACGGGSSSSTSTITLVGASCNPTAITSGQTSQCTASVSGTGNFSSTVTWTASSGGTINASSGLFTATTVPFTTQVTITATSTQDNTKNGSTTLTVAAAGTVTGVTATCSPTSIQTGQLTACTATVQGTGNFSPNVDWSAVCSGNGCLTGGSINPITGLFSSPYSGTYSIIATSQQNPQVTGNSTVDVVNPVSNKLAIVVDAGPTGNYVNGAFAIVTVCAPKTASCQTIDHVLVDTGSVGLRLLAQAAGGELNPAAFPQQVDSNNNPIGQCNQFADGFTWGSVALATIQMAGETTGSVPNSTVAGVSIQIIGDTRVPAVPSTCTGVTDESNLAALGAYGVLGVGNFEQDCGPGCVSNTSNTAPNEYYSCAGGSCTAVFLGLAQQVTNPVWVFPADNNGVLIELPSVPAGGTTTVQGNLFFGIGTQSNNGLGSATVFETDSNANFVTTFNGLVNKCSYIDSGSNAYFFPPSNYPQLVTCTGPNSAFYCPTSLVTLTASNQSATEPVTSPGNVSFNVGNANTLLSNTQFSAFSELGVSNTPVNGCGTFDWGLPFFYGQQRGVFTAIENQSVTGTSYVGPFWAY